uniref:Uncharacterized protein n=1 Tax=Rhizophora mucronata TaxID=61149 RepID=A0A2P2Q043_RHIMU
MKLLSVKLAGLPTLVALKMFILQMIMSI